MDNLSKYLQQGIIDKQENRVIEQVPHHLPQTEGIEENLNFAALKIL
jgi:hypothetical protein